MGREISDLPWTPIPEKDRWEILILNLIIHVNPLMNNYYLDSGLY